MLSPKEARQQQSAAGNRWLSQTFLSGLPAAGSDECYSKAAVMLVFVLNTLFVGLGVFHG